jgi:hypothetical protein
MREEIIEYLFTYLIWTVASLLCCIWFFKAVVFGGNLADLELPEDPPSFPFLTK